MKTLKTFYTIVVLTLLLTVSAIAQSQPKVIAVVNKAEWCSVCVKNGDRAMAAFMDNNKDGVIVFIANDLSNDETKQKSYADLNKYALVDVMASHKGTGSVYFFNVRSKSLINKISVSKANMDLVTAMETAKKSL